MAQRQFPAALDDIAELPESPAVHNRIPPLWGSSRLRHTICAFIAMALQSCLQNTLHVAILCMVKHHEPDYATNYTNIDVNDTCDPIDISTPQYQTDGALYWSKSEEYLVLASYYYGYVITSPFGGRLADKFRAKRCIIYSLGFQSLVFTSIAFYVYDTYVSLVVIRFIQGLIAGFFNPAIYQLFTVWAHTNERTAFVSIAHGGNAFGIILTYPLTILLCTLDWQFAFIFIGCGSMIINALLQFIIYNKLEDDDFMSEDEYNYLNRCRTRRPNDNIPWKDILTSAPVYAFICIHLTHNYGILIFTLLLPRFFHQTMRFPFDYVGLLSAAPSFGALGSKPISIFISYILEKSPNLDFTKYRRALSIFYTICAIIFGYGIIYCTCHERVIVVILTLFFGAATDMAITCGYLPSLLHIAPSFVGLITGIANSLGGLIGFLAPLALSNTVYYGTKSDWNLIIFSTMISYSWGIMIFAFFGSSEREPWDQRANLQNEGNASREIVAAEEEDETGL